MKAPSRGTPIVLAVSIAMLALAMDPIVPSLPAIRASFGVDVAATQLVLSALVVGFAIAQVVIGPLSDRFGRLPVLIGGWIVFVLASIACAFAPTLDTLIAARVVQAIGCCAPVVVGRAVVRDLYGVGHTAKMLGLIMSIGALPIFLAPWVGGIVEQHLGWRWNFGVLALLGITMITVTLATLPETHRQRDASATDLGRMLVNYRTLITDRRFFAHAAAAVGNFAMIFTFLSGASFALISLLGLTPSTMGFILGIASLGFAVMSLTASRLVTRLGTTRLLMVGSWIILPAALAMAGLALAGVYSLAALMIPYALILIGVGFTNSSSVAGAIGPFPKIAGTASSLLGLTQFVIGGIIANVASRFHDGTPVPMALAVAASGLLVFFAAHVLVRGIRSS